MNTTPQYKVVENTDDPEQDFIAKANKWFGECPARYRFQPSTESIYLVAEYIANQKGYTLWDN